MRLPLYLFTDRQVTNLGMCEIDRINALIIGQFPTCKEPLLARCVIDDYNQRVIALLLSTSSSGRVYGIDRLRNRSACVEIVSLFCSQLGDAVVEITNTRLAIPFSTRVVEEMIPAQKNEVLLTERDNGAMVTAGVCKIA